ncbi:SusC/RagA family TonB-linked outer membrane protein [Flavobacterium flavipallidum]|uniref:TonB-dependent receptor n=1 Tax=Flavobacterium flavipallidum TaxID=3139140 RepID=A0ABU9HPM9_9FLAO
MKRQLIKIPRKVKFVVMGVLFQFLFSNTLLASEGSASLPFLTVEKNKSSQQVTVSGTITSADDRMPIPGVTVKVKGDSKISAVADFDGKYKINLPSADAVLVFSSVGFKTIEKQVNGQAVVNVVMASDQTTLEEVVVVGYGTMKRSDLTGSVVSIGAKSIEESVATTLDQVLQGRVAGLQMTQNSGVPGAGTSVQIRGVNSLNGTNEPIYVIDGVIISGETGSNTSNVLANINPNDIESLEVLKDASATAIYGAQGANGVIIITMKKGKDGATKVSFNSYYGYQELSRNIDMMDLRQYAKHFNARQLVIDPTKIKDKFSNPSTLGKGTNWQDAIFRGAPMKSYNLSVRGGNKVSNFTMSLGHLNQDGVTVSSKFERTTLRLTNETNLGEWLRIGTTINGSYSKQESGIASWDIIPNSLYQSPEVMVVNADGSYGGPDLADSEIRDFTNPYAMAQITNRDNEDIDTRGSLYLLYKPAKWINFRTEFTADLGLDNYKYFRPQYQFGASSNAYAQTSRTKTFNSYWGWKNILNLEKTFNKKHKTSLMLGHEVISSKGSVLSAERLYGSSDLDGIDAGDPNFDTNSGTDINNPRKFLSFFGRGFYSFDNKYQFTGTLRYDQSSRFARGKRGGVFPSAAFAWRVSEEKFFSKYKDVINNLKLRLSYGEVGNANVSSAYAYQRMLQFLQSNWGSSLETANIENPNLTWETTKSWNVGLDLNLFNNRVELIAEAYIKQTDDLLLRLELPSYLGATGESYITDGTADSPWYNIGSMKNKGIELTLNTVNIDKPNFSWKSGLTFSLNRNEVSKMNEGTSFIDKTYQLGGVTSTATRTSVGNPISQFYGYKVIGRINSASDFLVDNGDGTSTVNVATVSYKKGTVINNTATNLPSSSYIGDLLYKDVNGDGIINDADMTNIGNPLPKFTYGITNSFKYKNFDMSVFFYGSQGGDVMNWLRRRIDDPRSTGNLSVNTANYVKIGYLDGNTNNNDIWNLYVLPGASSDQVRLGVQDPNHNSAVSTRFVEDGSFLRLQNISFGYSFPKKVLSKFKIDALRVYTNLQNVYTFSKYKGFDPEVGATQSQYSFLGQSMLFYGVDVGRIPPPRIYTFGIDLTF